MNDIIHALKASIGFEQNKRSVTNLLNHKPSDLSVLIDLINEKISECSDLIKEVEKTIDNSEDMAEIVETVMRSGIAEQRNKIENLCAWRMIFASAWQTASKKL